jgi:AhpD family alkylhydroperoxidase
VSHDRSASHWKGAFFLQTQSFRSLNFRSLSQMPPAATAWKPDHFRAFFQFYDALMKGPSGLTRAEREMIVLTVSAINACTYCTVSHGAALRVLAKHPHLAAKVTRESAAIDAADLARLREHGFSDADIWDIGAVAAFFNLSNRMANLAEMRPNAELYTMGRDLPVPEAAPPQAGR